MIAKGFQSRQTKKAFAVMKDTIGRVAVVAGAARGIGQAVAVQLDERAWPGLISGGAAIASAAVGKNL